jgi:hypothetical protein
MGFIMKLFNSLVGNWAVMSAELESASGIVEAMTNMTNSYAPVSALPSKCCNSGRPSGWNWHQFWHVSLHSPGRTRHGNGLLIISLFTSVYIALGLYALGSKEAGVQCFLNHRYSYHLMNITWYSGVTFFTVGMCFYVAFSAPIRGMGILLILVVMCVVSFVIFVLLRMNFGVITEAAAENRLYLKQVHLSKEQVTHAWNTYREQVKEADISKAQFLKYVAVFYGGYVTDYVVPRFTELALKRVEHTFDQEIKKLIWAIHDNVCFQWNNEKS